MSYVIDRLDDFARGITKVDGKTCFVFNALEQEEVDIDIINSNSKYLEGISSNINNKSVYRKDAECPYYNNCGGCNLMHMTYKRQLEFKKYKVQRLIKKYASIDNIVKDIIPSHEFKYRNKVSLKVIDGKLGYYKEKTHELINISKCLLLSDVINNTIEKLNKLELSNIDEIVIRSNYNNEILLLLKGKKIDSKYFLDNLYDIDNIIVDDGNRHVLKGNDYFIDKINDLSFKVSIDSFYQVNYYNVVNLYNKVLEYAKLNENQKVLDLYCGTGTIGMFLARNASYVYGVEINKSAVDDANYNKEMNNISNIEFLCSDVGLIKNKFKDIDLVVIDPPRAGLSSKAIKNVLDINSKRIIYVSCDPITLARDLNILKENYNVIEITPVDMFPNTYHCESVCILERR